MFGENACDEVLRESGVCVFGSIARAPRRHAESRFLHQVFAGFTANRGPCEHLLAWCSVTSSLDDVWYGRAPTWKRTLAAVALGPASLAMRGVVATRNALFDARLLVATRIEGVQIVSVGNLVVGGAGKTPLVIFLAQWALALGKRVAVVSRGYGRSAQAPVTFDRSALPRVEAVGDEPRLIARRTGAQVFVDADRVRAATAARASGVQVVLLDDGFQHRRLARDVDIVVHVPTASEHVLPWGPCREPPSSLRRAQIVWNGPAATDPHGALRVSRVVDANGSVASLQGRKVLALSGIARPLRFFETLEQLGATVVERHAYGDHHQFTAEELERAAASAARADAVVVTTEKDRERLDGAPVWVVETELEVTANRSTLAAALGWAEDRAPLCASAVDGKRHAP